MSESPSSKLLSVDEVSKILDRSRSTLAAWRSQQVGPPSCKLGGRVMYLQSDLDEWVAEQYKATVAGDGHPRREIDHVEEPRKEANVPLEQEPTF